MAESGLVYRFRKIVITDNKVETLYILLPVSISDYYVCYPMDTAATGVCYPAVA
jgi:hypothetical protein